MSAVLNKLPLQSAANDANANNANNVDNVIAGMYFACIMMMCSLSVVFTVLVLNFHYRSPGTHRMPRWVRNLLTYLLTYLHTTSYSTRRDT